MANTKEVSIRVQVPFDWTLHLTDEEAKAWVGLTMGPYGLTVDHRRVGAVSNEHGGVTTMYEVDVHGREAFRVKGLAILMESLTKQENAEKIEAVYYDVDDPTDGWTDIPTVQQCFESEVRAHEHVQEMMRGKKFVTRKIAPGIEESVLIGEDESLPGYE